MKHSRRDFLKVGTNALGAAAISWESLRGQTPQELQGVSPDGTSPGGRVSVSPSEAISGKYGTWTVTYQVGERGLRKNGGLRVQLPDSWHSGPRNSANRLQATNPKADNYISSSCSRHGIRLRTMVEDEPGSAEVLVKTWRRGLDERIGRYIFVVRVWVLEGDLNEGDTVSVIYGDTSGGSRGMMAAIISTRPEPILVGVDINGSGIFPIHPSRPTLLSRAGEAAELSILGPSCLVVGRSAELRLSTVDLHANPADSFEGQVSLRVTQGKADLPSVHQFRQARAWDNVNLVPKEAGILRVEASGAEGRLFATSNPMRVFEQEPNVRVFWGDLHSHTHYSVDGVGHNNFEYAQFISRLDFYAMTDHTLPNEGKFTRGLGPHIWNEYTTSTEKHNDPDRFVTLHAYEISLGSPFGHHNVYFRDNPGPLLAEGDVTLQEVWKALTKGRALTIPHHTGKMPSPIFWHPDNPDFRRNIEIYSAHGLSEAYDPDHPLSFEHSDFTDPSRSVREPQYAQDAWIQGLNLSTVAASDDHRAHPGQPQFGLTAVYAPGLTRDHIFEGLYQRRTYGTTGARILLDFVIDGEPMGQRVAVDGLPRLGIEAHGTDIIELLEVLRCRASERVFKVIKSLTPGVTDFVWNGTDTTFNEDSIYYIRLRQKTLVRTRIAMAWSSPIWVTRRG